MREITLEGNTITFDGRKSHVTWAPEMFDEMQEFHGVDVVGEVVDMLVQELNFEFELSPDEKVYCKKAILMHIN